MTNLELVLNMLAEVSTTEISKEQQPEGLEQNKKVAQEWENAPKQARITLEQQTKKSIVSSKNATNIHGKSILDDKSEKHFFLYFNFLNTSTLSSFSQLNFSLPKCPYVADSQ